MRLQNIIIPALRFLQDRRGQAGIIFGLMAVPLVALAGSAIDYTRASSAHSLLQQVGDAAALAAISDTTLNDDDERKELAEKVFAAGLASSNSGLSATPTISFAGDTVTVESAAEIATAMLGLVHIDSVQLATTSVAVKAAAAYPACVMALDPAVSNAVSLVGTADLVASECAVQSNSTSPSALSATGSSTATATGFCAVGGFEGSNFFPAPVSGCAPLPDPFAHLPAPADTGCDHTGAQFNKGAHVALPGVYCGGMTLKSHAAVVLTPGVYVLKGELSMNAHSSLIGTGVVLWLTGDDAILNVRSQSIIDVTAPTTGDYAGVAIAQDPSAPDTGQESSIEGGGSIRVVGSVYLPTQLLKVGGGGDIGTLSPYMPLIAKSFTFHGNSSITVNLDAAAAGMPEDQMPDTMPGQPRLLN